MNRRAWKWVLGVLGFLALSFGAFLWNAHSRATDVFDRHDRLAKEAMVATRARQPARPALQGSVIEGNGWKAQQSALSGFAAIPDVDIEEIPAFNSDPEFAPDRDKLAGVFEKHAPLVEELRKAGRYRMFLPNYSYEDGIDFDVPHSEVVRAAKYLSALAEFLHENGNDRDASEVLALGLALGHDAGRSGAILSQLLLIVSEGIQTWMMRKILSGHSFQASDLESFARKIDRLWETRPSMADALEVEHAAIRRTLVDFGRAGAIEISRGAGNPYLERSWRYLFSRRLATAAALEELEQMFARARGISKTAPHLRAGAMETASESLRSSRNPILTGFKSYDRIYLRDAVSQMSWTLMRVATGVAWHESERGRLPEKLGDLVPRYLPQIPVCPLTGLPLGYRDGIVWSAGRNGIDDGGSPGKDNDSDAENGDVVWTVSRK